LLPITLPVTVGLGENAAGVLNALIPVPASGGELRPLRSRPIDSYEPVAIFNGRCSVEPQSIRTTLFPCSRLWSSSCLGGRTCDQGASSRGPRFTYGCSRYVFQLGYPLLIPLIVAPVSLFERLRSSRGSVCLSSFCGVARATPAGVAPEPLEESLTPSRVMLPYLTEALLTPLGVMLPYL